LAPSIIKNSRVNRRVSAGEQLGDQVAESRENLPAVVGKPSELHDREKP
jgi:hypothetical protein